MKLVIRFDFNGYSRFVNFSKKNWNLQNKYFISQLFIKKYALLESFLERKIVDTRNKLRFDFL